MLVYPEVCVISKEVFMSTKTVGCGSSGRSTQKLPEAHPRNYPRAF